MATKNCFYASTTYVSFIISSLDFKNLKPFESNVSLITQVYHHAEVLGTVSFCQTKL